MKNLLLVVLGVILLIVGITLLTSCEEPEDMVRTTYCWECEGIGLYEGENYTFCNLTEEEIITFIKRSYIFTCEISN